MDLKWDNPELQVIMPADQKLIRIYHGNMNCKNDGMYLDGGIKFPEDRIWQELYDRVA